MNDPSLWVYEDNDHDPLRHRQERADNGFSVYDWWNFNSYLSWVIQQGLIRFREGGRGHPVQYTPEEWNGMLDDMIDGFKALDELEAGESWDSNSETYKAWSEPLMKRWDKGKWLFIDNFGSLWD